jgi:hypothetical protein
MSDVPSARRKVQIQDVEDNRPVSESVNRKIGGSINYLLDRVFISLNFTYSGWIGGNVLSEGLGGIIYIERDSIVSGYYLSLRKTGSQDTTIFNCKVYDSTGAFVGNLFGSGGNALSISGSSGTDVIVGKKEVDTITPTNVSVNTAGHTVFNGNVNILDKTLLAGYYLVPFLEEAALDAYHLNFDLRLKEL